MTLLEREAAEVKMTPGNIRTRNYNLLVELLDFNRFK